LRLRGGGDVVAALEQKKKANRGTGLGSPGTLTEGVRKQPPMGGENKGREGTLRGFGEKVKTQPHSRNGNEQTRHFERPKIGFLGKGKKGTLDEERETFFFADRRDIKGKLVGT